MKVYLVTSGDYSAYHVDAVFSTEDLANDHAAELKKTGEETVQVEGWNLDEMKGATVQQSWCATINLKTGTIKSRKDQINFQPRPGVVAKVQEHLFDTVSVYSWKSEEHARKLAVERRQSFLREHGPLLRTQAEIMEARRNEG